MNDRYKIIKKRCQNKEVLDLGSLGDNYNNKNWLFKHIKETAKSVQGLDINKNPTNEKIIEGDVTNFNLNQKFEVIVAGELIEHIYNFKGFLESVKKHMKSESIFILSTPNAFSFANIIRAILFGKTIHHKGHKVFFDKGTLTELLNDFGFEIQKVVYNSEYEYLNPIKSRIALMLGKIRPILNNDILVIAKLK